MEPIKFTTLVAPAELALHLAEPDWAIVDCRFSLAAPARGQRDYEQAHIPGAVYAHLNADLSGPIIRGTTGRHPLPDPERFRQTLETEGLYPSPALKLLDAETMLARFMVDGMPQWNAFHVVIGGAIAEMRLQYPAVRAYGEMVDILWQRGEQQAAIRLEEFWNDIGQLQTFSLLCAYAMDPLRGETYAGLESICRCHGE